MNSSRCQPTRMLARPEPPRSSTARTDALVRLSIFVPLALVVFWVGVSASGEVGGMRVLGLKPAWYAIFTSCLATLLFVNFIARRSTPQPRTPGRFALVEVGAGAVVGLVIGEMLWDRFDLWVVFSAVFCACFVLYIARGLRELMAN